MIIMIMNINVSSVSLFMNILLCDGKISFLSFKNFSSSQIFFKLRNFITNFHNLTRGHCPKQGKRELSTDYALSK